jgi:hypothetical protein
MRSRIRRALLAVGAALNVSGVMDFSLLHSRNWVLLKRDSDSGQAPCDSPSEPQGNSAPSRRYQSQP